jgi:hypothetical protein
MSSLFKLINHNLQAYKTSEKIVLVSFFLLNNDTYLHKGKGKVVRVLLIKHYAMKTYRKVEV